MEPPGIMKQLDENDAAREAAGEFPEKTLPIGKPPEEEATKP